MSRSAEALRALKPDERRALMLKAQGYSYQEIGEHFGWTYTKVNRSITEGRRRFMKVFQAIESGEACERYMPTIAALAGGSATSAEVVEIRPHLRHCVACRATVRRLHLSTGTRLGLLLPALAGLGTATAPAEHTPVLDADQLAILLEVPERSRGLRLGRFRDELLALLHRANGSDAAAGAYIATSGGGRISTIAAVIAFCVSGAGAGALCVATGVVQAPGWILGQEARPPAPRPHAKQPAARRGPARLSASARSTDAVATATPVAVARPVRPSRRVTRPRARTRTASDPSQGTTPTSHESAPITPAPRASTSEFAFESSAGSSASQPPASAPATGGGEFTP